MESSVNRSSTVSADRLFIVTALALLALCLAPVPSPAQGPPAPERPRSGSPPDREQRARPAPDTIVERLQATYQRMHTYRTAFTQETSSSVLHADRTSSGKIMFKKPGRMRWTYESPRTQEVFLLPERIYVYLPDEHQVMTASPGDYLSGITPTKFLMGMGNLREDFTVWLIDEEKGKGPSSYRLRLTPKESGSQIKSIDLWVRAKDFVIEATESIDFMGNRTLVRFSSQEINPDLPDSLFSFEIPKDAEVIDNAL